MVYLKFIVEDDYMIMSKCEFHRQLVTDSNKVKGGGLYRYDKDKKYYVLFGTSQEFGKASIKDIKKCIRNNKVFYNTSQTLKYTKETFYYDSMNGTKLKKL